MPVQKRRLRIGPIGLDRGKPFFPTLRLFGGIGLCLLALSGSGPSRSAAPLVPRALIVGGGPDLRHNQVGIESNVRYVAHLLSPNVQRTILFADGNPKRPTVQYERPSPASGTNVEGERAFDLLFEEPDSGVRYRRPRLARIDGPAEREPISSTFDRLHTELSAAPRPLFLYFTGHGGPASGADPDDTSYELWGAGRPLKVHDLAAEIRKVPNSVPIALVMVQCFSGGFGDLLFEGGSADGRLLDRDLAGFFAATPDRMAAGCTSAVNEAEYKDFSSYFFAALSGRDRTGRKVEGADYNHDGVVTMNEAFAYSLVADDSIDVPVCTSDVFLRRFVKSDEAAVFEVPYASALAWAAPEQRAALEGLSEKLGLTGEDRLRAAYAAVRQAWSLRATNNDEATNRFNRVMKRWRDRLIARWPELAKSNSRQFFAERSEATRYLQAQAQSGSVDELFHADDALAAAEDGPGYSLLQSRMLRFVRLAKSVVLAHRLLGGGNADLVARFRRLRAAEAGSPFVPSFQASSDSARTGLPRSQVLAER